MCLSNCVTVSGRKQYALVTTGWQRYKLTSEWKREIVCFAGEPWQVCAQRLWTNHHRQTCKGEVKSSCLCLAVLYFVSIQFFSPSYFSFTACSAYSLCLPIQHSSSPKPASPSFSSSLSAPPTFHSCTIADLLLLKQETMKETETCQVCLCVCECVIE